MSETDLRVSLDMILKSEEPLSVEVRRALLEEVIDRFQDVLMDLKLPPGMSSEGLAIDGDASPGEDRKQLKQGRIELAMLSRNIGRRIDPRRR